MLMQCLLACLRRIYQLTLVISAVALLCAGAVAQPVPVGIPGSWTLVFQDEFSGTALNKAVWGDNWLGCNGCITKPVNSAELGAYDPKQVAVSDGYLRLTAIRSPVTVNGKTYQYRSGLINSARTRSRAGKEFTSGVFEARIWMTTVAASSVPFNWGAWWLNGHHNDWPDRGENDIMENLSGGPAWHYHAPNVNTGRTPAMPSKYGWHIYTAEWSSNPRRIRWYYDGKLAGTLTSGVLSYPQYMILNYAISTQHGGPISVPLTMSVDYVRVWKAS